MRVEEEVVKEARETASLGGLGRGGRDMTVEFKDPKKDVIIVNLRRQEVEETAKEK